MKKTLLTIMILLLVNNLILAVETEEKLIKQENQVTTLSKSDSFLTAFGMKDFQDRKQNQVETRTIESTSAHASAISLTHLQNTPYSYK